MVAGLPAAGTVPPAVCDKAAEAACLSLAAAVGAGLGRGRAIMASFSRTSERGAGPTGSHRTTHHSLCFSYRPL